MCQQHVLELVLQWLGDTSIPDNKWMLNRDCYEQHLQCVARLMATSKLDSTAARDFVSRCYCALLTQYTMVLQHTHANGFCTSTWYHNEKKRLKQLRDKGPKHALASLQDALKQHPTEQQLIFQLGGGEPAAETYLYYLEVKEGCSDDEAELSDEELSDVEMREAGNSSVSDSESGSEASIPTSWTQESQRYKDWVIMLNAQRWICVTTTMRTCPGMKPSGSVLGNLCKDSVVFEKAWFDAWPLRWRVRVRLP